MLNFWEQSAILTYCEQFLTACCHHNVYFLFARPDQRFNAHKAKHAALHFIYLSIYLSTVSVYPSIYPSVTISLLVPGSTKFRDRDNLAPILACIGKKACCNCRGSHETCDFRLLRCTWPSCVTLYCFPRLWEACKTSILRLRVFNICMQEEKDWLHPQINIIIFHLGKIIISYMWE